MRLFTFTRLLGLDSVYETVLEHELQARGLNAERQRPIPIVYGKLTFSREFAADLADLIVNDSVIIELKSVEQVAAVHRKQLLTYLRLADKRLGLLINFGATLIKDGFFRVGYGRQCEAKSRGSADRIAHVVKTVSLVPAKCSL